MTETKVLRWEFEGISKMGMDDKLFSPITTIHGLLWHMVVRKDEMPTAEGTYAPFFGCFLVCCEGSDEEAWTVEHESTIVLVNRRNTELNLKQDEGTRVGSFRFISPQELLDAEAGFIKDDKIIVEAHVALKSVSGFRTWRQFDFSSPSPQSNVVLKIEGKEVHVCKQQLAVHSPVFESMFFGDFVEKNKEEIELKDICHEEFIELLNLLYPSGKYITHESVRYILPLAHFFQIEFVLDKVESYLKYTNDLSMAAKLLLADRYGLHEVQTRCMRSLCDQSEIKDLKKTAEYADFSDKLRAALLEEMFKRV